MVWALILFLLPADTPESQHQYQPMLGMVKSVDAESTSFDLKSRSGTSTVKLAEKCSLQLLKRSIVGEIAVGSSVHILGQRKEVNWGSGTTTELLKVKAIVVAKDYVAPPVPAKLARDGFAWHTGDLTHEKRQNKFFIEQMTWVHVNKETAAYIGEETSREKLFDHLKKKRIVWVQAKEMGKKKFEAKKLVVFVGKVPKNELPLLVDPGAKKRKKR